ncbi:hypothetical protein [Paraburkholderia sp. BCC1885]|uniref:hypothetical protein n=1 Tax=Paraburkholderia sp. BCC1885 TaxID=2562669 RepID=UPI001183F6E3|nr:hypothetical protein [Paraburkholderia sp. BCC1885]
MLPVYEILSLFHSPEGHLAEIRRLDLPSNAPRYRVHHWLWIAQHSVTTLQSVDAITSHSKQHQCFEEASLSLDRERAHLRWCSGEEVGLVPAAPDTLPARKHSLILDHLS